MISQNFSQNFELCCVKIITLDYEFHCEFDDLANEIVSKVFFRVDERNSDTCIGRDDTFSFFCGKLKTCLTESIESLGTLVHNIFKFLRVCGTLSLEVMNTPGMANVLGSNLTRTCFFFQTRNIPFQNDDL